MDYLLDGRSPIQMSSIAEVICETTSDFFELEKCDQIRHAPEELFPWGQPSQQSSWHTRDPSYSSEFKLMPSRNANARVHLKVRRLTVKLCNYRLGIRRSSHRGASCWRGKLKHAKIINMWLMQPKSDKHIMITWSGSERTSSLRSVAVVPPQWWWVPMRNVRWSEDCSSPRNESSSSGRASRSCVPTWRGCIYDLLLEQPDLEGM